MLPYLEPLERWEVSQPGNVLRIFERGGERKPEIGIPSLEEQPGKPGCETRRARIWNTPTYRPSVPWVAKDQIVRSLVEFPRYK